MTKINQTLIRDNSICYYASLGYQDAVGMIFDKVGLSNSENNYQFVPQEQVNLDYNTREQQKLSSTKPNTKGTYFYRVEKAKPNNCNKILTVANLKNHFVKTSKNRIDIIYKMDVGFGD